MADQCIICGVDYTPSSKSRNQVTCTARNCHRTNVARNRAIKRASMEEGAGCGLNADGSVKEFYLVRGIISTLSTVYSSFEGGSVD